MKVILIKDVPKVGKMYDVKDFADGYAQNVLINKGLAIRATSQELVKLEDRKKKEEKIRQEENKVFDELLNSLNTIKINLKAKANEKGHLFKAVSKNELINAIKNSTSIKIEEENIEIPKIIKELGQHTIILKKSGREGKLTITVENI